VLTLGAPLVGLGGRWALALVAATGAGLVALALRAARRDAPLACARDVFAYTMGHLAVVLAAIALSR
jgi:heme O synthase-like polyprenyltransferase